LIIGWTQIYNFSTEGNQSSFLTCHEKNNFDWSVVKKVDLSSWNLVLVTWMLYELLFDHWEKIDINVIYGWSRWDSIERLLFSPNKSRDEIYLIYELPYKKRLLIQSVTHQMSLFERLTISDHISGNQIRWQVLTDFFFFTDSSL
jgi:hypothetical protein